MKEKLDPVSLSVREAVGRGEALPASEIIALRVKHSRAIVLYKGAFWVGIAIFNVALWAPLPFEIARPILVAVAILSLLIAVVVPIFGLKKHQVCLEKLKLTEEKPKRKNLSEAGRAYADQVRQQDRPFTVAEYEVLLDSAGGQDSASS